MNQTRTVTARAAMVWMLGISALAAPVVVEAQPRWGRPNAPRAGACFYRDSDFRGDYFCAGVGQQMRSLGRGMNDQISSIRIFGDAQVRIFQATRYRGKSNRIDGDVFNLRREGWNDRLSSFIVRNDRDRRDDGDWGRGSFMGRRDNDGRAYDGRDNDGYGRGNDPRANDGRGINDGRGNGGRWNRVDADRVIRDLYQEILQREPDTAGFNLYRNRMENEGWNEAQVREALRTSPEYRKKNTQMTRQRAEQMVAAAYQSVLDREPGPASRSWVDRVIRETMTQAQLEAELRKSDEYRDKRR